MIPMRGKASWDLELLWWVNLIIQKWGENELHVRLNGFVFFYLVMCILRSPMHGEQLKKPKDLKTEFSECTVHESIFARIQALEL